MNTTAPQPEKKIPIEITMKITVKTTTAGEMNAVGVKNQLDQALEIKKDVESKLPSEGATIDGAVKIGKQKFKL
jgi:hypothetical protein